MSRMQRFDWVATLCGRIRRPCPASSHRQACYRRLSAESLEDRRMLAIMVDTLVDEADGSILDGDVSLRDAIALAPSGETIEFDAALDGGTIPLTLGELAITNALTIDGTALSAGLTIDAGEQSRIFNIDDGGIANDFDVTIAGLTLTGGQTTGDNTSSSDSTYSGGAIRSVTTGNLTIDESTINSNSTIGFWADGGGVYSYGDVTLTGSTVSDNSTAGERAYGGGVQAWGDVTLTDSTVSGNSTMGMLGYGGGIRALGYVTLTDSTVSGNSTAGDRAYGGGVKGGTITLKGSTVSGNSTAGLDARGGGVYASYVMLTNSTVSGNSTGGENARGGGINASAGVTLRQSTISGNSTTGDFAYGGGIYSLEVGVTLTQSTVSGNSTVGLSASGGGIFALGFVTLTNSTISGNSTEGSDAYGGGVYALFHGATITNSTITDNHATYSDATGGGIWNKFGPVTITGSIIAANTAGGGSPDVAPGIGTPTVEYSLIGDGTIALTIATGTAPFSGSFQPEGDLSVLDGMPIAGTWTLEITDDTPFSLNSGTLNSWSLLVDSDTNVTEYPSSDTPVTIEAGPHLSSITIVDSGTIDDLDVQLNIDHTRDGDLDVFLIAPDGTRVELFTDVGSTGDNFTNTILDDDVTRTIESGSSLIGTTLSPIDPLLGPLADNGGPTETHALVFNSPAIDAGDPDFAPPPNFDQRGAPFARVFDGDADTVAVIDMGAYERQFVVDTNVDEDDGDFSLGDFSLREAIRVANGTTGIAETITFDPSLNGVTIALILGELVITESVTINAIALADGLTVDAQEQSRIFNIDDSGVANDFDITIAGLTLTGGRTTGDNASSSDSTYSGGAIRSLTTGTLTIDQSTISGNSTEGDRARGGGLFSMSGNVTLAGSTINGNSTAGDFARGGGVYAYGDVTLIDSTVSGNSTGGLRADGGGVFAKYGGVTLMGSTVSGNSTAGDFADGGGVDARDVTLNDSTVSGNSTSGDRASGGGINSSSSVMLIDSTVSGNSTAGLSASGGGVKTNGDVTLTRSTVSGNSTTGVHARGGGVNAYSGNVTLTDSTVSGNSTTGNYASGGGMIGDVVTIIGSTISGNSASSTAGGGGIWAHDAIIIDSTVSGNIAAAGGGVYTIFGNITLTHSTVTDNHATLADAKGGGISQASNLGPSITIDGSIVAGNTAVGGSPDLQPGSSTVTVKFSLIGDNDGTNLIEAQTADADGNLIGSAAGGGIIDPLLGPLTDNGGPTETHVLLLGSPAIDAGDPGIVFNPAEFDQRGAPFARVVDGDDAGGARIDMGAYEDNAPRLPPAVIAVVRNGGGDRYDLLTAIAVTFTEDVSASLDKFDLVLENTSTTTPVDLTPASVMWDGATNTATWDLNAATVETGFHTATLLAAGISDSAANALDGNMDGSEGDNFQTTTTIPFIGTPTVLLVALPGDTNLDGEVDTTDISNMLSANGFEKFEEDGVTPLGGFDWTQGDFTGDTIVNTDDITAILAKNVFEMGPYALASQPAVEASLEPVTFSAPGVSMPLVGDVMQQANLRAAPVEVSVPRVSRAIVGGVMLKHNLRVAPNALTSLGTGFSTRLDKELQPMRRPLRRATTAEVDLAIRDLADKRVDGRRFDHPTVGLLGEVDVLDTDWDDALLTVIDEVLGH